MKKSKKFVKMVIIFTLVLLFVNLTACININEVPNKEKVSQVIGYYQFEEVIIYKNDQIIKQTSDPKDLIGISTAQKLEFIISSQEIILFSNQLAYQDKSEYSINKGDLVLKNSIKFFGMNFYFDTLVFKDDSIIITNIKDDENKDLIIYKKKFVYSGDVPVGHYRFEKLVLKDDKQNIIFQTESLMTDEEVNHYGFSSDIRVELDGIEYKSYVASSNRLIEKYFYTLDDNMIVFSERPNDIFTFDKYRIYYEIERKNKKECIFISFVKENL